jgi:hypothetical protein
MRFPLFGALAYLVLMATVLDRTESDVVWLAPVIILLQVAVGFVVGRWPAVVLPALVVLISIPAGYPPSEGGEPFPLWFGLAFSALFAIALIALGVVGRKLYDGRALPVGH